jgi:hypothetical protein
MVRLKRSFLTLTPRIQVLTTLLRLLRCVKHGRCQRFFIRQFWQGASLVKHKETFSCFDELKFNKSALCVCVCVCVCARARACVCVCACVCVFFFFFAGYTVCAQPAIFCQ